MFALEDVATLADITPQHLRNWVAESVLVPAVPGGKGQVRGNTSNEHVIGVNVAGPTFQIAQQRIANILWEWQSHLISPLPGHLQRAAAWAISAAGSASAPPRRSSSRSDVCITMMAKGLFSS